MSLPAEPKGKAPIGAFQMLLPHGDECDVRSASVPLSERALPKSCDRVWGIGLVWMGQVAEKELPTLPVMAAILRLRSLDVEFMYTGGAR